MIKRTIILSMVGSLLLSTVEGHYLLSARWWLVGMVVAGCIHVEVCVLRPLARRGGVE